MSTTIDVLAALADGDWEAANDVAQSAAVRQPDTALVAALAGYLGGLPAPGVYDEPSAFEAFIDHGTNPELYRHTIGQLAAIHADAEPATVLDIGCGDGRVTANVVSPATTRVDLVEPADALLTAAVSALEAATAKVVPHAIDVASFLAGLDDDISWDIVQSTFALHTTLPGDRPAILGSLARRARRLLIVEFDVPDAAEGSPEHLAYLADRYERGVAEYRDHPEVITGFLLPVLVGQLDPDAPRHTYEQPIAQWTQLLEHAGFSTTTRLLFEYWWADAILIDAIPQTDGTP